MQKEKKIAEHNHVHRWFLAEESI